MIGILNLKTCNLASVTNAVYQQGFDSLIIDNTNDFNTITHLIIPGVGHFKNAIHYIKNNNLDKAILDFANQKKPILGICLGMQLLASISHEGEKNEGLNLIEGEVNLLFDNNNLRLPHIGWNEVNFKNHHPLFEDIKNHKDFYFVHSYHFELKNDKNLIATCDYGQEFSAIIAKSNIVGCQFHPEKSQKNGLQMIENFCNWDGI